MERPETANYSVLMNDTRTNRILLATRVLGAECDKRTEVSDEDQARLRALAKNKGERRLRLGLLAALVLDRERQRGE